VAGSRSMPTEVTWNSCSAARTGRSSIRKATSSRAFCP
jgi:hypothetical protein